MSLQVKLAPLFLFLLLDFLLGVFIFLLPHGTLEKHNTLWIGLVLSAVGPTPRRRSRWALNRIATSLQDTVGALNRKVGEALTLHAMNREINAPVAYEPTRDLIAEQGHFWVDRDRPVTWAGHAG